MALLEQFYNSSIKRTLSQQILFEIVDDFTDRRGLRQEWEQIDEDIQEEILSEWLQIIERNLLMKMKEQNV